MAEAEVVEYKKHWRERAEQEVTLQRELASKARAEAMRVAQVLVRDFGARRVYLYGSLAQEDRCSSLTCVGSLVSWRRWLQAAECRTCIV